MSSEGADGRAASGDLSHFLNEYLTPSPIKSEMSEDEASLADNDGYKKFPDSSNEMRQLPVAQVSPSIPPTPPTRLARSPSSHKHLDRDERARRLFDMRLTADKKYAAGHGLVTGRGHMTPGSLVTALSQKPMLAGMTPDQWASRKESLGNDLNNMTSYTFAVPQTEETINQSSYDPDVTLTKHQSREKHHSGSPGRRRASSVPPKKRDPLPPQDAALSPTKASYPDQSRVQSEVHHQSGVQVPAHMQQHPQQAVTAVSSQHYHTHGGSYDYHPSSGRVQDLAGWQRSLDPGHPAHHEDLIGAKLKELSLAGGLGLGQTAVDYYHEKHQHPYGGTQVPQVPPPGVMGKYYQDPRLDLGPGLSNTAPAYGTSDFIGFERVIQAKDRILQERDLVIQRQKMELGQLQQQERSREAGDRHKLYSAPSADKSLDLLLVKLQEKDYEIHRLQAQLAQETQTKQSELEQLNQELGKAEYDAKRLMEREKDGHSALKKERDKLTAQIKSKDAAHEETREKYRKQKERYTNLKGKLQSMERHMADLPTADEHARSRQEIASLQRTEGLLKERIASLESTLTEAREVRKERESLITALEEKDADLEFELQRLKTELGRMQLAMGAEEGVDPTSLRLCPRKEIDEITKEKERLMQEVHQLRKVADSKHKQIKRLQSQHQEQVRDIESRLMQEEDCSVGLREELKNREHDVAKMRKTLKDLSDQNQELLSLKLRLQEKNRQLEEVVNSDRFQAGQRLAKELSECVAELQNVMQVCLQTAEGAEPNVSMLLGLRSSSSMSIDLGHPETDEDAIQRSLEEVHQIRKDMDILRAHITDKFAEDVGNNCITH